MKNKYELEARTHVSSGITFYFVPRNIQETEKWKKQENKIKEKIIVVIAWQGQREIENVKKVLK
jgi:hypothetical protein